MTPLTNDRANYLFEQMAHAETLFHIVKRSGEVNGSNMHHLAGSVADEVMNAVRGNRADGTPLTWSDMRLIVIGLFRRMADELEAAKP